MRSLRRWALDAQTDCEGGYRYEDAFSGSTKQGRNTERVARRLGSRCLKRRRNTRDAAMRWRGCGRSCRGFGSKRTIDSKPMTGMLRSPICFVGDRRSLCTTSCLGPTSTPGCPSCSAIADGFNGIQIHLANHDVMLGGIAWAACEAAWVQKAHGLDVSVGILGGGRISTPTTAWVSLRKNSSAREGIEYNYRREGARCV